MRLWDPIRSIWVAATPEEKVRQRLLHRMISEWGFPKSLIGVEKDLASLPSRKNLGDPNRRIDLICYAPLKEGTLPLLLVECKAVEINEAAERQLLGYNALVGAFFIALANETEIKTIWVEQGRVCTAPFLPPYSQLIQSLC
ncbi:MAG: type I restriction enzyme HsdR N-terminal domain-containing protein [Chlamydiota bacterium]